MRYPIGDGTKETADREWYIASSFGENRDSYFHSGVDWNRKTGGDSDLGERINAIANGKLVYYHEKSHPNSSYGIHNVYEVDTPSGKRWIHQAHCQSIRTKVGSINEGDEVARLGKSGTKYAHVHFSVFKVDPKSLPYGIDTIATSKGMLNDIFEDPILFIEKGDNMKSEDLEKKLKECKSTLEHERGQIENYQEQVSGALGDIDKLKKEKEELKNAILKLETQVEKEQEHHQDLVRYLAETLDTTQRLPDIKAEIEKLIVVDDKLVECSDKVSQLTKENAKKDALIAKYNTEITKESGYTVKTEKGISRAFGSFKTTTLEQADKNPKLKEYDTLKVIKELIRRLKLWQK